MGTLSDRVRRARRHAGFSQAQLAHLLDSARSAVAHWEREGGNSPTTKHLLGIVTMTGVSFEWLAMGRGAMHVTSAASGATEVSASVARDDVEEHLLVAFRELRPSARNSLLSLLREMSSRASMQGRYLRRSA